MVEGVMVGFECCGGNCGSWVLGGCLAVVAGEWWRGTRLTEVLVSGRHVGGLAFLGLGPFFTGGAFWRVPPGGGGLVSGGLVVWGLVRWPLVCGAALWRRSVYGPGGGGLVAWRPGLAVGYGGGGMVEGGMV